MKNYSINLIDRRAALIASGPSLLHYSRFHHFIGRLAVRALYRELVCFPKPGLVSTVDSGSHNDMNAATFFRSLFALRHYFIGMAQAGDRAVPFAALQAQGIAAEQRMLHATGGVNTHRGAVFALGLLAAAAGWLRAQRRPLAGAALGGAIHKLWSRAILADADRKKDIAVSHGRLAALRYGAGGARAQAAAGFPALFDTALPVLAEGLRRGCDLNRALVQTFFTLMASLIDTNLLYRGGPEALAFAQHAASDFLACNGVYRSDWRRHAAEIHRRFVQRRLSPGGSADLLSATLFVFLLQAQAG